MKRVLPAVALMLCAMSAFAQSGVVDEKKLSVRGLIDDLNPRSAVGQTRGWSQPSAPASQPKSAVLLTFTTNSAHLSEAARGALEKVVEALQSEELRERRFMIEGHADKRGAEDLNLRLSEARADSVRRFLVEGGISAARLTIIGKGDREPLNRDSEAAPENRRVTFVTVAE